MGRIKIPEIKSGDSLSSSKFNEINSALIDFKVEGSNIAEEGINQTKVKSETVFSNITSSKHSSDQSFTQTTSSLARIDLSSELTSDSLSKKSITTISDAFLEKEQLICRASARVFMADYGSRTFYAGIPPTICVQLIYSFDSSPTESSTWFYATGTKQLFSVAFSSKIPSDSGGDSLLYYRYPGSPFAPGGTYKFSYRTHKKRYDLLTRGDHVDRPTTYAYRPVESDYSVASNENMFFEYDFSYTTGWSLKYEDVIAYAPINQVTFALAVGTHDKSGNHPSAGYDDFGTWDKPAKGARTVKFKDCKLKNCNVHVYKVKK
tara:strand:+ start:2304 stop:3263 length:960 start_codon:yes stop_codon:yes gene_type:complete